MKPMQDASTNGAPWYVCVTKPRQEAFAQLKLQEQGYEVYLPLLSSWQHRQGRWQRHEQVMFPRYAFVRPGRAGQAIGPVRSTPGVSSLVSFGHVLGCLPPERLAALRALVLERAQAQPGQPLQPGTAVVFASGPLKGMSGLVSSVAAERVMVMMSLLGREQVVSTSAHHLAAA